MAYASHAYILGERQEHKQQMYETGKPKHHLNTFYDKTRNAEPKQEASQGKYGYGRQNVSQHRGFMACFRSVFRGLVYLVVCVNSEGVPSLKRSRKG